VPAAVSASGDATQKPFADYARQGLDAQVSNISASQAAMRGLPTPADEFAKEDALEKKRDQDAQYISARDPLSGKVLSEYRPTVGQRILRGVRAFGSGVPAQYGAPNDVYQNKLDQQRATVAADDQSIGEQARRFKSAMEAARANSAEQRANAGSAKDLTSGAVDQEKADTENYKVHNPAEKAPTNYEQTVVAAQNEQDPNGPLHRAAQQMRDTEVKKFQSSNPGRQPTDTELWRQAFKSEYHRDPNAEEVASRHVAGGGQAGEAVATGGANGTPTFKDKASIDKYSQKWYADHRKEASLDKERELKLGGGDTDDAGVQAKFKEIEEQYAQQAKDFEAQKKDWYGSVGKAPAAAPAAPAAVSPSGNQPAAVQPPPPNQQGSATKSDVGKATAVRRNPKTNEQAYLINGKWYRDSELK
jgi:hypothetical protein